jgi:hypothetical protein
LVEMMVASRVGMKVERLVVLRVGMMAGV